jgi:hypothetical protein
MNSLEQMREDVVNQFLTEVGEFNDEEIRDFFARVIVSDSIPSHPHEMWRLIGRSYHTVPKFLLTCKVNPDLISYDGDDLMKIAQVALREFLLKEMRVAWENRER